MRRAVIATAGTAAAVAALLTYKSSNAVKVSATKVSVKPPGTTPAGSPSSSTTASGAPTTTAPPTTSSSTTTAPAGGGGTQTLTGTDVQYPYGELQLRVTRTKGKITKIDVVTDAAPDFRSRQINTQALAILIPEAIAAQGININAVSGATFTSEAFAQALQSAIDPSGT